MYPSYISILFVKIFIELSTYYIKLVVWRIERKVSQMSILGFCRSLEISSDTCQVQKRKGSHMAVGIRNVWG